MVNYSETERRFVENIEDFIEDYTSQGKRLSNKVLETAIPKLKSQRILDISTTLFFAKLHFSTHRDEIPEEFLDLAHEAYTYLEEELYGIAKDAEDSGESGRVKSTINLLARIANVYDFKMSDDIIGYCQKYDVPYCSPGDNP